ncbi:MAG: sugar phosphate isomerase/epimerase family protein [Terriglobales bacterium]
MKLAFTVATPDTRDANMAAFRGEGLDHAFFTLSKLGYDAAELMVRNPAELDSAEIERLAATYQLAVPAISTGQLRKEDGLSLNACGAELRGEAVRRTREVIDFAARFNAQVNIGSLRGQMPVGPERAAAVTAVRASLTELLEYAAGRGVALAIEPQCRYVSNWLNTVAETMEFASSFPDVQPHILFDVYHASLEERSVAAAMIVGRERISWVQLADSHRGAPGDGQMNFGEHIRVLEALGYDGYLSVECNPFPEAESAPRRAAAHLKPLLPG